MKIFAIVTLSLTTAVAAAICTNNFTYQAGSGIGEVTSNCPTGTIVFPISSSCNGWRRRTILHDDTTKQWSVACKDGSTSTTAAFVCLDKDWDGNKCKVRKTDLRWTGHPHPSSGHLKCAQGRLLTHELPECHGGSGYHLLNLDIIDPHGSESYATDYLCPYSSGFESIFKRCIRKAGRKCKCEYYIKPAASLDIGSNGDGRQYRITFSCAVNEVPIFMSDGCRNNFSPNLVTAEDAATGVITLEATCPYSDGFLNQVWQGCWATRAETE